MKLQDYAHYYIGASCFNTWFTPEHDAYDAGWKLCGIRTDNEKCYMLENETDVTWVDSIALKLRRLEDMTEDEIREYGKLVELRTDGVHSVYISCDTPESYHYLLQQGFDLFGLITAGLAVDIKTITP